MMNETVTAKPIGIRDILRIAKERALTVFIGSLYKDGEAYGYCVHYDIPTIIKWAMTGRQEGHTYKFTLKTF